MVNPVLVNSTTAEPPSGLGMKRGPAFNLLFKLGPVPARALGQGLVTLTLGLMGGLGWGSAIAAERVSVNLGILGDSFQVSSLETYAKTGEVPADLRDYLRFLNDDQKAQLRQALLAEADVSVVAVAQFLYSPQGEVLLERLGQVIQSEARQPGFFGIRAALILAAAEPGNITLIQVLEKFPTPGVRISLGRGWEIAKELTELVEQTKAAVVKIKAEAETEAAEEVTSGVAAQVAGLPNLTLAGPLEWERETLVLEDGERDRKLPVDIYVPQTGLPQTDLPQTAGQAIAPWPTVVISHGLKSDRSSFAYLAEHLASHGFAVIVPEHPGSNTEQFQALLLGRANEISDPREFVNRPLDITFILNRLGQHPRLGPQLNLNRVGIMGQSFGGYTALALGGAELDEAQLTQSCQQLNESWNVSLALQCRALAVLPLPKSLRDPRISAVVAINPFTSAVFGREGLKALATPTLVVAGNVDTVAPALMEQIQPFRWIQGPDRHLALMVGGTHFSSIAEAPDSTEPPLPEAVVGPDLAVARDYTKALSLASFETYLTGEAAGVPYLSSSYAKTLARGRLGLALVQQLP